MKKIAIFCFTLLFFLSSQVEAQKTIGIFTYLSLDLKPWDPDSVNSGIAGSEEAVIYMSQKLANLGYKVTVFGNPPKNSPHSHSNANPRFVSLDFKTEDLFDIAIAWRNPTLGKSLHSLAKKVFLWPHDTCRETLTSPQINAFDDILWLSEWQRLQWISVNPEVAKFNKIFGNGINPEQFQPLSERKNPYSCIYGSNYGRGLEQLLTIWPTIKQEFPKATLDIYYGWQHWGVLSQEREQILRKQIEDLKALDVKEHGKVSHASLTKAFEESSFWTYPCPITEPETFCITALRAQVAGAIPVIIQHSALYETARNGFLCQNPADYLSTLQSAMRQVNQITFANRQHIRESVLKEYTWERLALRWKELFETPVKKTVCLALVVKDNAQTIEASLNSIKKKIDTWVIIDKGSTDGTQKIIQDCLKDLPGTLVERSNELNHTNLLNEALFLAKTKADYLLFLNPGEELVFAEEASFDTLDLDYYYSVLNPQRELIVKSLLNWKWTGVFNQQLICLEAQSASLLPGVLSKGEIGQPFNEALESFCLAHSYFQVNEYEKALKYYERAVSLKDLTLTTKALYSIGLLNELLKKPSEIVVKSYENAYESDPLKAEPLFRLAVYYLNQQNNLMGYKTAKQALSIPKNPLGEAWIYDHGIPFALGNCAFNLGKYEEAKDAYELALSKEGISESLKHDIQENLKKTELLLKRE